MANVSFSAWLSAELQARDWSLSKLADRSGLSPAAISMVLSEVRNPGPDLCLAIANAFGMPADVVFRIAGLLPPEPEQNASLREALHLFDKLTDEQQAIILVMMRALWEESERAQRPKPA